MNRVSRTKLKRLVELCEQALRDKSQQSLMIWRGDMWAIISAAHELKKRGLLEDSPGKSPRGFSRMGS